MDKKQLVFALMLGLAVMLFMQSRQDKKAKAGNNTAVQDSAISSLLESDTHRVFGGKAITDQQDQLNETPRVVIGSTDPEKMRLELELDPRGAGVYAARLAGHYKQAWQGRKKDKTPEEISEYAYSVVSAVEGATGGVEAMPFATQMLLVDGKKIDLSMSPLADVKSDDGFAAKGYIAWEPLGVSADGNSASFRLNIYDEKDGVFELLYRLVKTYTLKADSNSFDMSLRVENHTDQSHEIGLVQFGPTGLPREGVREDARDSVIGVYMADQKAITVPNKGKLKRTKAIDDDPQHLLGINYGESQQAVWAAAGNQFFGSIMYPKAAGLDTATVSPATEVEKFVVSPDQQKLSFYSLLAGAKDEDKSQLIACVIEPKTLAAGADAEYSFDIFCGPKGGNLFDNTPLYSRLGYRGTVTFRSCALCFFEPLARGVMWIIENGGKLIGNYGVIIILLVCVIRLLLHPITRKSQVSMMKMKDMQPQMQAIQEKYKDDKEALQREMMQFWKTTGATPILGCLPMLIQMPIWIALWSGLSASVVLRHQGLLPFWITDLAGPDTVWTFAQPLDIPILSGMMGPITGLHILPLLLTVAMFLQQKFTPSTATPGSEQEKQQKIMMSLMPIMMLVFFYNAPSGLTLYIMASTGSSVVESWIIRRHIAQRKAAEAPETIVSVPGKASRGNRPKKPKAF